MVDSLPPFQPGVSLSAALSSAFESGFGSVRALAQSVDEQAQQHERASAQAVALAGLVPFKTTRTEFNISLDKEASALARVKRLKRSVWASGHLHGIADHGHRPPACWFVTLTYVGVKDWQPMHIAKALDAYRKWCKGRGLSCRYTWVAELQSRGAVHYHLLCWLPQGVKMPKWDQPTKTAKLGQHRPPFWPWGMTNTQPAKAGVGYLMKYLSKLGELTVFPKGLRLYGIGGLDTQGKQTRQWFNLPQWAKQAHGVGELARLGSQLVVKATGELLQCPYLCFRSKFNLRLVQIFPVTPKWADGAYSSVSFA